MISEEKRLQRERMKALRAQVDARTQELLSCQLCKTVLSWDVYRQAKTVMLYAPIGRELSLMPLCENRDKRFVFPRMTGEVSMEAALYEPDKLMSRGRYRFMAPVGAKVSAEEIDLILLPALACDRFGNRLGYGKGCYDRFVGQEVFHGKTAAVVYDFSLADAVAHDALDAAVQYIITPTGVWITGGENDETV